MAEKKVIISGEIGFFGTMPVDVRAQLEAAGGEDIDVHISSPGGFVFEGIEIYNMIRDYKRDNPGAQITITLKGEAASMASYIASNPAADLVLAEDNAVFMIHNPWDFAIGDYRDMEKSAEILRGIGSILNGAYANRSGKTRDEIQGLMDAETFYFGDEIKAAGFADEIITVREEEKTERDQAVASSRVHLEALKEKMRTSGKAQADIMRVAALLKHEATAPPKAQDIAGVNAPQNSTGGQATMADENVLTADDITLDWLNANKPELVDEIKKAAAQEEQERIEEIDEAEENCDDETEEAKALFKKAKYEEPRSSGDVLKDVFRMQAERKKKMLADRREDAAQIPAVNGRAVAEQNDLIRFMREQMKSIRRRVR